MADFLPPLPVSEADAEAFVLELLEGLSRDQNHESLPPEWRRGCGIEIELLMRQGKVWTALAAGLHYANMVGWAAGNFSTGGRLLRRVEQDAPDTRRGKVVRAGASEGGRHRRLDVSDEEIIRVHSEFLGKGFKGREARRKAAKKLGISESSVYRRTRSK